MTANKRVTIIDFGVMDSASSVERAAIRLPIAN
jgi:hypothetical protein